MAAAGVATWISVAGSGFVFYLIIESWLILVLAVCEPILFFLVLISVGVWTRNDFTTLAHPRERLPPHSACCKSCVALDYCVPCCTANPVCKGGCPKPCISCVTPPPRLAEEGSGGDDHDEEA